MWILRLIAKILVLPLRIVVALAMLIMWVAIYAGSYVVGAAVWLCGICCIIALVSKMFGCAIFFAAVLIVMFAALFGAANIQLLLQAIQGKLRKI